MVTVVRGLVSVGDKDALLETAYDKLVPSDWGRAYWMIFRAWSDMDDPPPTDAVQGSSGCGSGGSLSSRRTWIQQQRWRKQRSLNGSSIRRTIPDTDIVRLGLRTARLAQGQLQMYLRWNRMLSLAQANPDETFSIAEAVLLAELRADYPHVPVEDVKRFLAHILKAGNSDTQARARRLINRLGERGYRQLKDLLDENGGASG